MNINRKLCAALAAMALATAAFAAKQKKPPKPKFPPYLEKFGSEVTGYKDDMPADLVIPEGVKEIGERAFYRCTNLKSLTIRNDIQRVGKEAFSGCRSLKKIEFGGTKAQWKASPISTQVNVLSVRCSDGCIGLEDAPEYLVIEGTKVTRYVGAVPANLVIPEGVTAIEQSAFQGCNALESVTIPGSVTKIMGSSGAWRYGAFMQCANLTTVTIAEGVTSIGGSAFSDCTSLKSVSIPKSVTAIGSNAFEGCVSLASVTIPEGVTYIGGSAFRDCSSLKEIQFKGTMAQWKALKGSDGVRISFIRCSDGNIGVESVPEYLKMDGTVVTGYTGAIPADLVIPDGVTAINKQAFKDCKSLASVTIPSSVTTIGGNSDYKDKGAFYGCTSLESVTIPDSVKEIGDYAFYGCTSLKEVQFGGTKAQWNALKGSDGVKAPFVRCTDGDMGVAEVPPYLTMTGTVVTGYTGKVPADLVIPDGVTEIGSKAFKGCLTIESVTIPGSVRKIGKDAFSGCSYFERVTIGHGVTEISGAFRGSMSLVSVTIPNSVTEIGSEAFSGCAALESVTISEGVQGIGMYAFYECTSLKSVTIPGSVTKIGKSAFRGAGLENVTIAEGVTSIGIAAFSSCTSLKSVTIPGSVKVIEGNDGDGWKDQICGAFTHCTSLASVTILDGVQEIGGGTFMGCTSLKSVTISRGVTIIGYCAFQYCTSLASVIIPRSVTGIGEWVFSGYSLNLKIQYDGTKAQWNAISGFRFIKATVQCKDGEITQN